jgi:hypothetical protein
VNEGCVYVESASRSTVNPVLKRANLRWKPSLQPCSELSYAKVRAWTRVACPNTENIFVQFACTARPNTSSAWCATSAAARKWRNSVARRISIWQARSTLPHETGLVDVQKRPAGSTCAVLRHGVFRSHTRKAPSPKKKATNLAMTQVLWTAEIRPRWTSRVFSEAFDKRVWMQIQVARYI